jgi:hypothetical protein
MKMVKNIFLLILLSALGLSQANADGTFYLVRHAEKQDDGTKVRLLNVERLIRLKANQY